VDSGGVTRSMRNWTELPNTFQQQLMGSLDRLHESAETVDLMNILSSISREHDARFVPGLSCISQMDCSEVADTSLAPVELYTTLAKRLNVRSGESNRCYGDHTWPTTPVLVRKRSKAKVHHASSTGLVKQLLLLGSGQQVELDDCDSADDSLQDGVVSFVPSSGDKGTKWVRTKAASISSGTTSVAGPLRAPVAALQQLVRDRLFLLDDHCIPCNVGHKSSSVKEGLSSKQLLLQQACARIRKPPSSGAPASAAAPDATPQFDLKVQNRSATCVRPVAGDLILYCNCFVVLRRCR
jgi:hypothetical protein